MLYINDIITDYDYDKALLSIEVGNLTTPANAVTEITPIKLNNTDCVDWREVTLFTDEIIKLIDLAEEKFSKKITENT